MANYQVVCSFCVYYFLSSCYSGESEAERYQRISEDSRQSQSATAADPYVLDWDEPIYSTNFDLPPNPNIDGKSLAGILQSVEFGRDDRMYCSSCHNVDEQAGGYGMNVEEGEPDPDLTPTTIISGRTWIGNDGWGLRFIRNATKPNNIKTFIQAYLNSRLSLNEDLLIEQSSEDLQKSPLKSFQP